MKVAVIGLGVFGESVCRYLHENGVEVMAIDHNMDIINEAISYSTHAIKFDATNIEALKKFNIHEYDCVIVSIGENFQDCILVTSELKELGVKRIISRATSEINRKILLKIGADEVFIPEKNFGENLASKLIQKRVVEVIKLSSDFSIMEIITPKMFKNKTLQDLNLRKIYNINVVTIRKRSVPGQLDRNAPLNIKELDSVFLPSPDTRLDGDEVLVIVGKNKDVHAFAAEE